MESALFFSIDLTGAFVFALSGVLAAIHQKMDILGLFIIAFVTACGGGVIRDICIGSLPPAGMINFEYLVVIFFAVILGVSFHKALLKITQPTLFFDAIGLGFYAAFGAHKTYLLTHNIELAILLGGISAVGGGIIRDVLMGHIPMILTKEIYASAALLGASIQMCGEMHYINNHYSPWIAIFFCTLLRMLSLKFKWNLPSIKP